MRPKTSHIILATTVVSLLAGAPVAAQTETEPTSEAGARAVEVDGVLTISETSATRDGDGGGTADATVIGLGGEQVVGGSAGEDQDEASGEILTTGEDNEDGFLTVGGWSASVDDTSSDAETAVVEGNLGGEEGISGSALTSESHAEDGAASATTTGATLDVGGGQLHVEVLKATTSSDGEGESYILMINGEKIATSDDADGQCEIPADPVLHLLCLYAEATEGEDGATGAVAGVADVSALEDAITAQLVAAESASTEDLEVGAAPPAGEPAQPAPDTDPAGGPLPRTGGGLFTGLAGLLSMGAGLGLRRFANR